MEKRTRFLSREEAIELLHDVIESDILKEEISDGLEELASLIRYELSGEHFWNQPYESAQDLGVAYREDLWTPELIEKVQRQHVNARFVPAPNELEDLKAHFMEIHGCDEEADEDYRRQCEDDFALVFGINVND